MSTSYSQDSGSSQTDFGSKYSQIIDYTEQLGNTESQGSDIKESFNKINHICTVIEETFRETQTTSDYLLDMNALHSTTQAAKNLTKNVNSKMKSFNVMDFACKLLEKYQNERGILDLPRLHKYGDAIIRRTYFNPFVLNTFVPTVTEIEAKKRTVTRREKDVVAEKKTSEKVSSIEKTDLSINEIVVEIMKCLTRNYRRNGERPLSFFHFTIDPESFSKTIENIFHTSFLVRDNKAKISIGTDGMPTLEPVRGKSEGKENGGNRQGEQEKAGSRRQMFVEMTPSQHKELVELLDIRSSMIPTSACAPVPLSTVQKRQADLNPSNVIRKHRRP